MILSAAMRLIIGQCPRVRVPVFTSDRSARKFLCQLFVRSTTQRRGFLPRIGPVNAGSVRRRICGLTPRARASCWRHFIHETSACFDGFYCFVGVRKATSDLVCDDSRAVARGRTPEAHARVNYLTPP
jgi:hypothetical protein